jgi:citrate lyase beta subunit
MDLRPEPSGELHMMPHLMQRLIILASATGVQPIGAWWRATSRGLVATREETLRAAIAGRQAGFQGALCMRAHQVDALHEGFALPSAEQEAARTLMEAHATALDQGKAVVSTAGLIDAGRAAASARVLAWARAAETHDRAKARVAAANAK